MTSLKLKPGVSFAPAGYPFIDKRTNYKVDAYERSISGAVEMLIQHRKANPRVYPESEPQWFSPTLVREEILRHLKEKVPHIFAAETVPTAQRSVSGTPQQCVCGGTSFSPNYCKTCGSGMVQQGWICDGCGKLISA